MARTNLPHTNISRAGTNDGAEINGDPVNFHSTANDGRVWIEARNADASNPHTITVHIVDVVDGQTVEPREYTVPASGKKRVGPFPPGNYGSVLNVDVDDADLKLTAYHLGG